MHFKLTEEVSNSVVFGELRHLINRLSIIFVMCIIQLFFNFKHQELEGLDRSWCQIIVKGKQYFKCVHAIVLILKDDKSRY